MGIFDWINRDIALTSQSPQEVFAKEMRRAMIDTANGMRRYGRKGVLEQFMSFPIHFGSLLHAVRERYGQSIVAANSPAMKILIGMRKGGEAQSAIMLLRRQFDVQLEATESDVQGTLALMAQMINPERWREILDGSIILRPDILRLKIEKRAAAFMNQWENMSHDGKSAGMMLIYKTAEDVRTHVHCNDFLQPFDENDLIRLTKMERFAITTSDELCRQGMLDNNDVASAYALISIICSLRLGRFKNDSEQQQLASMATDMYAAARASNEH